MEGIIWTDLVRNAEVLQKVKRERNILQKKRKLKCKSIGQILHSNCLIKRVIEWKIEGRI